MPSDPNPNQGRAIESISAVTLRVGEMARAVRFYDALGFRRLYGGASADFTSFAAGAGYLNLTREEGRPEAAFWGRVIFYVADVDRFHGAAVAAGLQPQFSPRDARWGERYFHITDPDGHELSFAAPLAPPLAPPKEGDG